MKNKRILEMQIVFSAGGSVGDCIETAHNLSVEHNATISFKCNSIIWTIRPTDSVIDFYKRYDIALTNREKTIGEPPMFLKHEMTC